MFIIAMLPSKAQYTFTKLWDKTLGGNSSEYGWNIAGAAGGAGALKCFRNDEGNILIGGSSGSQLNGDKTQANWNFGVDAWLVAMDVNTGQKVWDRRYGGFEQDAFEDLVSINNKRHVLLLSSDNHIHIC